MKKPTGKQQLAIDHFIVHRDKSAAYRHAYSTRTKNVATVHRSAFKLFNLPHVEAAVKALTKEVTDEAVIDAAWVLKRSALLANFNINKFMVFKDGVALYDFALASDDDWYCIQEITIDQIGVSEDGLWLVDKVKLKGVDKLKALDQVGKNVGVQAFKETLVLDAAVATTNMDTEQFKEARRKMLKEDDC